MRWIAFLLMALVGVEDVSASDLNPGAVFQATAPAVVLVTAFETGNDMRAIGTGSLVRKDGLVLTNAHVIFNRKSKRPFHNLRVILKPEKLTGDIRKDTARKVQAELIVYSSKLDLAILKVMNGKRDGAFPTLNFGDSGDVSVGDPVVAIGHPQAGGLWTLTTGTISSHLKDFEGIQGKDVFQTEASINRGNSGGPLLDSGGRIIGINTSIARQAKDGLAITDINFSIKSRVAVAWLKENNLDFNFSRKNSHGLVSPVVIIPEPEAEPFRFPKVIVQPKDKPVPKPPVRESQILTPKHPYQEKDLFWETREEMQTMMDEMRQKLKRRKTANENPFR